MTTVHHTLFIGAMINLVNIFVVTETGMPTGWVCNNVYAIIIPNTHSKCLRTSNYFWIVIHHRITKQKIERKNKSERKKKLKTKIKQNLINNTH